ncbi:ATP-binding protein [Aquiflexum sp.]|uniref:ATP-binding protein n=1 Tax=Aquiflexum sp. TaxID=1872584 RepID=UPI0035946167
MIAREAEKELRLLSKQFKAVAVVGPRQSGKTTLTRALFPSKTYVSLENPDTRQFAEQDPRGFLAQYTEGAILDEAQRVPAIFSYLQQLLDESNAAGRFILTGSNNFLLQQNIVQSLAGRLAYLYLLPFSVNELKSGDLLPKTLNEMLFTGSYPPVFQQEIAPEKWFPNYIKTYVERDVRLIKNISNLGDFERFLRLCAGRVGQLLNKSSLGIEVGVDSKTIDAWLTILESSFIIHLLKPHHQNFNKRLVKMPKLYFHDTGLVCALLGIQNPLQIQTHPLRGSLFENFVIGEFIKMQYNLGNQGRLYFWRDNKGNEIDLIIDNGDKLYPIEIKAGQTITQTYFKGINFWNNLTTTTGGTIIYAGDMEQKRSNGIEVKPWFQADISNFF